MKIVNDNHMMAFVIEDFATSTAIYDPNFLKFYALKSIKLEDGVWTDFYYDLNPCTDEEFSKFYDYENKQT